MTKHFVLRPHALLSSYDSTLRFGEDNVVAIPLAVVDEIFKMKDLSTEKSKIRGEVLHYINSFDYKELTTTGVKQKNGSMLKLVTNYTEQEVECTGLTEYQKRTLQVCLGIQKEVRKAGNEVVLVTNNIPLQLRAKALNIKAEKFKDEIFPVLAEQYTGRIELEVPDEFINKFYKDSVEFIDISELPNYSNYKWYENCYVVMSNGSKVIYGKVKQDKVVIIEAYKYEPYGLKPLNEGQRLLIHALSDDSPLVIVKGAAGTGKTLFSLAIALDQYENREFKKILISRQVENNTLGYLPGGLDEKLGPFMKGIMDNLETILNSDNPKETNIPVKSKKKINERPEKPERESGNYLFERGIIEHQALGMLRGRSIMDIIFIIDEVQNIEPEHIKTIITRAAKGSKFIILGDPTQIDNPKLNERYNGLVYLSEKMKGDPDCTIISLKDEESVRSSLARTAIVRL